MDANPKGPYLLKLLAGPNQGAEIALNEETLIVGSGDTADIVLSDSLVAAEHLQLHVENDVLTLTALAPGIAYENKILEPNKPQVLDAFKPVGLGTSYFVVGPQQAAWPEFTLEQLLQESKKEAKGKTSKRLAGKIKDLSDTKIYILIGAIAFLFALIFFVWMISGGEDAVSFEQKQGARSVSSRKATFKELTSYLEKLQEEKGLQLESPDMGPILLTGYVKTFQERLDIERALRPYSDKVQVKLMAEGSILSSTKELLSMLKVSMTPEILPNGGLKLTGYAASREQFDMFKKRIMQDIPGIQYIEGDLVTAKDIREMAEAFLEEAGLKGKVGVGVQNDTLVFAGYLSQQQEDIWIETYTKIREALSRYLSIYQNVYVLKDKDFLRWVFGDNIDSVTASKNRWVSLVNGQKLFEGAKLEHDYVLTGIQTDRLIISKGSTQLVFMIQ